MPCLADGQVEWNGLRTRHVRTWGSKLRQQAISLAWSPYLINFAFFCGFVPNVPGVLEPRKHHIAKVIPYHAGLFAFETCCVSGIISGCLWQSLWSRPLAWRRNGRAARRSSAFIEPSRSFSATKSSGTTIRIWRTPIGEYRTPAEIGPGFQSGDAMPDPDQGPSLPTPTQVNKGPDKTPMSTLCPRQCRHRAERGG
ncbi:hypothetical protein BJY04DRAFT_19930 [Aspergillus karnatakaensis]|uniref:uncharacterized protein n=1 Tax=Aspergillus karnatakaensis TaxID=1810916 RepID=UPI003CCD2716